MTTSRLLPRYWKDDLKSLVSQAERELLIASPFVQLSRHSDPKLTMARYGRAQLVWERVLIRLSAVRFPARELVVYHAEHAFVKYTEAQVCS
jgi:hypothetical protein